MRSSDLNTAIVYSAYGSRASYYDDWLDAFSNAPYFKTRSFNIAVNEPKKDFIQTIAEYDLIVLLHSVNADNLIYAREILPALQKRKGKLLSFVGNEISLPGAPMVPKIQYLKDAGADFIATQLLLETGEYLYSDTGAKVLAVPHALNPDAFKPVIAQKDRTIDVGMRSFRYPATFIGDEDRNRLIDLFEANAFSPPLITDISTSSRLDREGWAAFLNSCKATVSNEAGGHWIDKDDTTMNAIKDWIKAKSGGASMTIASESPLRRLAHKLPWGVRQWLIKILSKGVIRHEALIGQDEDFIEVYERFFKDKPFPPKISGKCVSSRHFDAVGTQTCQIMMEGRYNDIFVADEHYIPLKEDLSNAQEAVDKLADVTFRTQLAERTYEFTMAEHTYTKRMDYIYKAIS
ncbi:MAG: glycosyltransferase family protein [Terasakiella sp.]|uniref:glycosyltransferase family protein n=1 Tax=unclassified Terasakiella TaxID=2614952 RepID=UPI003AFFB84C